MDSVSVSVAKRLTAFRLRAMRDLALRTLESHYIHLPAEVRKACQDVVDAVLKAEEAVLVWQFRSIDGK